jgi:hypothetical protein
MDLDETGIGNRCGNMNGMAEVLPRIDTGTVK